MMVTLPDHGSFWPDGALVVAACVTLAILLRPALVRSPPWRAVVTPLASIIGSGFLVCGPVLAHIAGVWASAAMGLLCLAAWIFGSVMRFNIGHVEPLLERDPPRALLLTEKVSGFALAAAYFVSVAYYLNLMASFALKGLGVVDPDMTRALATGVISVLGLIGFRRGLSGLEPLEIGAVSFKLAAIAGVSVTLAVLVGGKIGQGTFMLPEIEHGSGLKEFGILLGLVILVQGFETSRHLGADYPANLRIRSMRQAQILSTVIYILFILLLTPFLPARLSATGGETQIIEIIKPLALLAAPAIILTALTSQLSAAIADLGGAGGLLQDTTQGRVPVRVGHLVTAMAAVAITWSTDIFGIVTWASKAFVLYYGLQAISALITAGRVPDDVRWIDRANAVFALLLALAVLVFGIPVEGA